MTDALFDLDPPRPSDPEPPPSPDRRRTQRQAATIAAGGHPLSVTRHPDTKGGTYAPGPRRDPLTCGSCIFRQVTADNKGRARFPKCTARPGLITHGAGTDCRAWWPACTSYVEESR